MIVELLVVFVPPLLIVFALAMEAVEDRLLRRDESPGPGARADSAHRTPPADAASGPHVPGRDTTAVDRDRAA